MNGSSTPTDSANTPKSPFVLWPLSCARAAVATAKVSSRPMTRKRADLRRCLIRGLILRPLSSAHQTYWNWMRVSPESSPGMPRRLEFQVCESWSW